MPVFPLICGWNIEYLYVLENIDIDKEISENIDIDKILNRLEFGISNRATYYPHHSARVTEWLQRDQPMETLPVLSVLASSLALEYREHI